MNQSALKQEVISQAEPHVSEALSSIKGTIKDNLEKGFDHFKDHQKEGALEPKTADIFYLTDVIEPDGSITTLKKQGETGMSDTETKTEGPMALDASAELPAVEASKTSAAPTEGGDTEAPETPETPANFEAAPAADLEIGGAVGDVTSGPDLASKETMAESAAAFSELADVARRMSSMPQTAVSDPVTPGNAGGYTVDALMREMLRPMLKEWLDAHLPSLVKWLVTEQIEKMLKDQLGVVPSAAVAPAAPVDAPAAPSAPVPDPSLAEEGAAAEASTEAEPADPTADMDFDAPSA